MHVILGSGSDIVGKVDCGWMVGGWWFGPNDVVVVKVTQSRMIELENYEMGRVTLYISCGDER